MYYIGVHSTNNIQDEYMGSGSYVCADIQLYGIENFTKEILFDFKTRKEAFIKEAKLITKKEVESKKCYNLILGGGKPLFPLIQIRRQFVKKQKKIVVEKREPEKLNLTILRTIRKKKGMILNDVALKVNISTAYLSLIERDKKIPNIEIVENICDLLGYELKILPIV